MNEDINPWVACDRCGPTVQALYLIKLIEGELAFCGHHYNEYKPVVESKAYETIELNKQEDLATADML